MLVEILSSVKCAAHTESRRDDQFQELHAQRIPRSENDAERRYTRSGRGKAKSDTKERKPDPTERTLYTRKGGFQCLRTLYI
jgi:hypothetical protein